MRRIGGALFGVVVLAVLILGAFPAGSTAGSPAHAPTAVAPHPAVRPPAASPHAAAGTRPLGVHPAITCPPTPPPSPVYTTVGTLFPMTPLMTLQGPCDLVNEDEVHATLSTTHAFSGEDYRQPVWLPPDTANATQGTAYYQVYVGMIVAGNPDSEWRQSYAEVAFTPNGTGGWAENVAVWSLVNSSFYGGNLSNSAAKCPANSMWFSWNFSYYCEVNEASNATFGTTVPGGDWVNVTFSGLTGGTSGLNLWVNDSTDAAYDTSYVFSSTNLGTYTFEPFYNTSCTDNCMLRWAYHFGLGFGIFPASYDEALLRSLPPLTFGIPHYWVNGAYTGDYQYFAPESASGGCYTGGSATTIASCAGFQVAPNSGYYPYFTFNGTEINFGADWPWTTIEWGGPGGEFFTSGVQQDIIPLSFYRTSNSSRAGFSPPAVPVWVNATVQDLGTVTGVNLTYALNGGNPTVLTMSLIQGTATNGTYTATIPSTVGNGILNYSLNASNHAGMSELSPPFGEHTIRRGPLPTFHVLVTTNLLSCGQVEINGTSYANGTTVLTLPGTYPLFGVGCYPWNFTDWTYTGGVAVPGGLTVRNSMVEVYGNGSLAAHWTYERPYDNVTVAIAPSTCAGSVTIGNQTLMNGQSALFLDGENFALAPSGCASELFAGWTFSGNFTILNPTFTPHGNGTLTANFAAEATAVSLVFYTSPASCGGVLYRGAGYSNGESLSVTPGTYPLGGDPCAHYGLLKFTTAGYVSATNTSITVNSSGSVTEVNYHLTEVNIQVNPAGCGAINIDGQNFTNGQVDVVANGSTHVAYPIARAGCYLIAFSANGGLTLSGNELIANGSGTLTASFQTTPPVQTIAFLTSPSTCGTIEFDGQPFLNSNFTQVAAGLSYTISALACPGYGFVSWQTFGEITITGSTAWVNSSGAIEAVFQPLVIISVFTNPTTCGTVVINGVNYTTNSTVQLASLNRYRLSAIPCAGYVFVGWQNTSGVEISGSSMYVLGGAFLTALFTPQVFAITTYLVPGNCGSVRLNGQSMANGSVLHLTVGSYALVPLPCVGDHLDHWSVNGSIDVAGSQLVVNGEGNLTAYYAPVVPTVTLTVPPSSLAGDAVELIATVPVLIPPYDEYNYTWTFGDGTSQVTSANATLHTYSSSGTFTVKVMVRDPDNRTANASATITILGQSAASAVSFTTGELVGFGLIAAALVAILALLVLRRRSEGGGAGSTELATSGPSVPALSNTEQKP